jgi:hypothetical protein
MRGRSRSVLVGVALFADALLTGGVTVASAGNTLCTTALGAVTINGNVTAGPGCDLSNTTVNGNVTVTGNLMIQPGSATTINGSVRATNVSFVYVSGRIGGDVKISGGGGIYEVTEAAVGGNVVIENGDVYGIDISNDSVGGNLRVLSNTVSTPIQIVSNTVGGAIRVNNNVDSYQSLNPNLPPGPNIYISGNSANDVLECQGNNPAPGGGPNTAARARGQCVGL